MSINQFPGTSQCREIEQLMAQKYAHYLNGRVFEVKAQIEGEAVYASVTLRNQDDSFHYPVEARVAFKEEDMTAPQAAMFLIDYIDAYFEEYLTEDEDLFIPIDWTAHEYCAVAFQMRGQIRNLKVERMADDLLASGEKYDGPQLII